MSRAYAVAAQGAFAALLFQLFFPDFALRQNLEKSREDRGS
jgi:hypothetical protein